MLYVRFLWQIINLIFKYVNYAAFCCINRHSIFGGLFQSRSLRQLKARLLIYNSTYRFLKWNQWKGVLHAVAGVTFIVGLHNFINVDKVLKFMISDNNKKLCYLGDLSFTLKKNHVKVIML